MVMLFIKKSGITQSHWLGLVNIILHAKYYQNIPSHLKVILCIHFVKIWPRRAIYKEIWH